MSMTKAYAFEIGYFDNADLPEHFAYEAELEEWEFAGAPAQSRRKIPAARERARNRIRRRRSLGRIANVGTDAEKSPLRSQDLSRMSTGRQMPSTEKHRGNQLCINFSLVTRILKD